MDAIQREIERIEDGKNAWEATDEVVKMTIKRPLAIVVPIRLSTDTYEALRQEAQRLGIGPSTLIRMWTLERLQAVNQQRRADAPRTGRRNG